MLSIIAVEVAMLYEIVRKQLGMIINSIRHGIVVTNREGMVMLVNRAASGILEPRGIILRTGCPFSGQGLWRAVETAVRNAVSVENACYGEESTIGGGETPLHLQWHVAPLAGEDGVTEGAIMVFEDVTEAVRLRRQMQDWERLATAGEVAAGLAHEIRNPLTAAVGAIALCDLVDSEPKRREILGGVREELLRMNRILADFLNFAKPGTAMALEPVNLPRILEEIKFLLRSEAILNDVEIVYGQVPEGFPPVMGDGNSLKQVFLNVAKNAVEAMRDGGRLEIALNKDEKNVCVSFKDNGPGIPGERIPNVFRPFFTTKLGGTGLGLSVSSSLVRRMGGELRVKSNVGEGTTVDILLPLHLENEIEAG